MKITRNQPCPCGSGRKYKHCCLKKSQTLSLKTKLVTALAGIAFTGIVIFALVLLVHASRNAEDQSSVRRVWSEEHQHWHYTQ